MTTSVVKSNSSSCGSCSDNNNKYKINKIEMKQEIVAQVHKPIKPETANPEKGNNIKTSDQNDNVNSSKTTPSREISVDGETQINTKILSLIETEMKRDINKHSHFTDSRPQSLSFYEDEKMPEEELSGNLELLSPEERKHYRKRKDVIDITDERNTYNNVIQDLIYNSHHGEIEIDGSTKKSKSSRKKSRHNVVDNNEPGMGDSREIIIPKEKRKGKKKKRDSSTGNNNDVSASNKRKHKKRGGDDTEYEPRNDITAALDELQDDVFDNNHEEINSRKAHKARRSPSRRAEKICVQKKNKFVVTTGRPVNDYLSKQSVHDFEEDGPTKRFLSYQPIEVAVPYQRCWTKSSNLCHGLLSGLAFGHWLYLISNYYTQDEEFIRHYAHYSQIYECFFYLLCVICMVSIFDKVDLSNMEHPDTGDLVFRKFRKSSIVILIYVICLFVHLLATRVDHQLSLIFYYQNETIISNITASNLNQWNHLSLWRSLLALTAFIILGFSPEENQFYVHLKNMEIYLPQK